MGIGSRSIIEVIAKIVFGICLVAFSIWSNIAYHKWVVKQAIEESRQEAKE